MLRVRMERHQVAGAVVQTSLTTTPLYQLSEQAVVVVLEVLVIHTLSSHLCSFSGYPDPVKLTIPTFAATISSKPLQDYH